MNNQLIQILGHFEMTTDQLRNSANCIRRTNHEIQNKLKTLDMSSIIWSDNHTHSILIIDGNSINTSILADLLRNKCPNLFLKISTTVEGLLSIKTQKFEIIFLDTTRGTFDAIETLRMIKEINSSQRVVVMYDVLDSVEKLKSIKELGYDELIEKPIQLHKEQLEEILFRTLENSDGSLIDVCI